MYPILWTHVGGRVSSTLNEVWTPENAADVKNTTWKAHVHAKAIWECTMHEDEGRKDVIDVL
jgi:hypothetical protein